MKYLRTPGWKEILIVVLPLFLLGFLTYSALEDYFAYQHAVARFNNIAVALGEIEVVQYGTVTALNPQNGTFTIQALDPYASDGRSETFTVTTTSGTAMVEQSLIANQNGEYDSLVEQSAPSGVTPQTITALAPGTHVRIYGYGTTDTATILALVIIFGNPL